MSMSRKSEERFLDKDEKEFVSQSHHPELKSLSDSALSDLIGKLRDRRDKARDVGARQRREMRGKAAPAGARRAADNTGTREKQAVLAAALKRLNKERERRGETVEA
ncbi:MAG: hypothetical protein MEP57_04010 [Microvirga sp.]|nr:hypothetical protein [Microvirga sp.]